MSNDSGLDKYKALRWWERKPPPEPDSNKSRLESYEQKLSDQEQRKRRQREETPPPRPDLVPKPQQRQKLAPQPPPRPEPQQPARYQPPPGPRYQAEPMYRQSLSATAVIASVLEAVGGALGVLGLGWLYIGHIPAWAKRFFGYVIVLGVVVTVEAAIIRASLGVGLFLLLPTLVIHMTVVIISTVQLQDYVFQYRPQASMAHLLLVVLGAVASLVFSCLALLISAAVFGPGPPPLPPR